MKRYLAFLCIGFVTAITLCPAYAADVQTPRSGFSQNDLPDALKPWAKWVLSDYKHNPCPFLYTNFQQKSCLWPGDLTLNLNESGGDFTLKATLYDDGWLMLPGNEDRWPQHVKAGNGEVIVTTRDGRPQLFLQAGTYAVTGSFSWSELPENLPLPSGVAMLHLDVDKTPVALPTIDSGDTLWLKRKDVATTEAERMELKVFRRITDDIPMTIDTRIVVNVSGKPREILLGNVLLDAFVPMSIDSPIPARLEPDGRLKLQVRPGTWNITVRSRHDEPVNALTLPQQPGELAFAKEEIWVFEPVTYLRLAQIDGVPPIDPAQTELPQEWRGFPAYYMKPGSNLHIIEKKRGNIDPSPDRLSLTKEWWLDYDGNGATTRDRINGEISQSWRLEVQNGITLGRAAINGRDQFITQLPVKEGMAAAPGIEVRPGVLNLDADGRIETPARTLFATGWNHDFQNVQTTLHLPPGWKLFHVTGIDSASDSWVQRWTLLDIFLVLIVLIVIQRLFGLRVAAITAPGFILLHHPLPELTATSLVILACVALLRVLPQGRFCMLVMGLRRIMLFVIVVTALPFMVQHMRSALFPQLGDTGYGRAPVGAMAYQPKPIAFARREAVKEEMELKKAGMATARDAVSEMTGNNMPAAPMPAPPAPAMAAQAQIEASGAVGMDAKSFGSSVAQEIYQYDPSMQSNTGFGIANWQGTLVYLGWNGPVASGQEVHLYLMSPTLNLALACLRIGLLFYIVTLLLGVPMGKDKLRDFPTMAIKAFSLLIGLWLLSHSVSPAFAEDLPNPQMLDEMKRKLIGELEKPPVCLPNCASVPNAHLEANGNQLSILMEIQAYEPMALPLPGPVSSWRPDSAVWVDGNLPATARSEADGYLYIHLERGVHRLRIEGKLPSNQDSINITFPLKPGRMDAAASNWQVQGIEPDGKNNGSVQLIFTGKREQRQEAALEKNTFPAFIQIERVISFGLSWDVTTTVRRLTPPGESLSVDIPLLDGETVTTADIPVKNNKAFISFSPQETQKTWVSQMTPHDLLALHAAARNDWPEFISGSEIWRLNISNLWHVTFRGIPSVKLPPSNEVNYTNAGQAVEMPSFAPWPGEKLEIHASKPEGVKGQTVTIDRSHIDIKAGSRSLEGALDLNIRASQGGQHTITLPRGAVLINATLNGSSTSLSVKDNAVTLPLAPGNQNYHLIWNQPQEMETVFHIPPVDLNLPSVNAESSLTLPQNRWILFTYGPQMGPAVLFWGWIPIILLAAFALGQLDMTPLRFSHWFLLFLGLTQTDLETNLIVAGWLLALGWRKEQGATPVSDFTFNLRQMVLAAWTLVSISTLFGGIKRGLLGSPNMRIEGNGSSHYVLQWYQDIAAPLLPQPGALSLPLFCYRAIMLVWALWLAFTLVQWLQWGWKCFSAGGYWKRMTWRGKRASVTRMDTQAASSQ